MRFQWQSVPFALALAAISYHAVVAQGFQHLPRQDSSPTPSQPTSVDSTRNSHAPSTLDSSQTSRATTSDISGSTLAAQTEFSSSIQATGTFGTLPASSTITSVIASSTTTHSIMAPGNSMSLSVHLQLVSIN